MRLLLALLVALTAVAGGARADAAPAASDSAGWVEQAVSRVEAEAAADAAAVPDIPDALSREWRSFDRAGSAAGALDDVGWVAAVALAALLLERGTAWLLGWRRRRRMRSHGEPIFTDLATLLACDIAGLAVFIAAFTTAARHILAPHGFAIALLVFASNVLLRWRVAAVVIHAVLRPRDPIARLIELTDAEARGLGRYLSLTILVVILLVGFGRYGLMDEDSGAAHVVGLLNAVLVCLVYVAIVVRSRAAAEALIRGRRSSGVVAALRAGLARAWFGAALLLIAGLLVFFVAGLSLGLLSYYHAVVSTLGIWFVLMVLDRLTERVWRDGEPAARGGEALAARAVQRIARAVVAAVAALALAWTWISVIEAGAAAVSAAMRSATAAIGTLFVALVVWELVRLAIDRHLQGAGGPTLPGANDDDEELTPASRLQTILPLVRAAFAGAIGVLAALIVLSRLGVDTAPLIAGAGVFGLAVSFGSQSLVRDIISGLFYMWDDAFRVGEYIDTGRLKGTVETLGIRSVKLRHQNGPLHTIPYGQLGAVTNLSRDYATIKFNLRFDPATDIELVRKTVKQIGLGMQAENPELAAEIILPLKLQGVAEVVDNAVVLRFKFTARPVKPSWVQREYLKRMVSVFAEKGVKFASGATMLLQAPPVVRLPGDVEPAATPPPARGPSAIVDAAAGG